MYKLEVSNGKWDDKIPMVFESVYAMADVISSISTHFIKEEGFELKFTITQYAEEMSQEEFDALAEIDNDVAEAVAEDIAQELEVKNDEDEHESV